MIEDTKPNCRIILERGSLDALAGHFGVSRATASNHLSGYRDTPRTRQLRLYALNEMGGRYMQAVRPRSRKEK